MLTQWTGICKVHVVRVLQIKRKDRRDGLYLDIQNISFHRIWNISLGLNDKVLKVCLYCAMQKSHYL